MKKPDRVVRKAIALRRHEAFACGVLAGAGGFALIGSVIGSDIVGAALGLAVILAAWLMYHAHSSLSRVTRSLIGMVRSHRRIERRRIQSSLPSHGGPLSTPRQDAWMVDLASFGPGDAEKLAAATLDRRRFPRLATAIDEEPPIVALTSPAMDSHNEPTIPAEMTTRNLAAEWNEALRTRDLEICRRLYATMVDTAPPQTVAPLSTLLKTLSKDVERTLREEFARYVRERQYAAAIEVGDRIQRLFPDHPIAREFEEIRPFLKRRVV